MRVQETYRDDLVVVLAGYEHEMSELLARNPGLPSRFPHTLHFQNYSQQEMDVIGRALLAKKQYSLEADEDNQWSGAIYDVMNTDPSNARAMRNFVDCVLRQQNLRCASDFIGSGASIKILKHELASVRKADVEAARKGIEQVAEAKSIHT